ncbi:MAG: alpha/beta hydrolase [Chitinophagaceae bacterium]|nr:alpha/beta hydrolase [Chitinophagaceae bacterium]
MKKYSILLLFVLIMQASNAQSVDSIPLYSGTVPGSIPSAIPERYFVNPDDGVTLVTDVQKPMLYIHSPAKPNGTAVLICPGGGYFALAMDHEGHQLAKWFNQRGITAFVLKSRLPNAALMTEPHMRPLQDAQQAMRLIRSNARGWRVVPDKIGIMGFSAGGHLAATVGTHFKEQVGEMTDATVSVRPDFMILAYPMISFMPAIYPPEWDNRLLGPKPSEERIRYFSNELHVTAETPPSFLLLAGDDFLSPQNSIVFYTALQQHKVPAELHIYEKGGHGFSLSKKQRGHVENWDQELDAWLKDRGLY